MKRLCDSFNRHRDGMLDPEQKRVFESHLAVCQECRTRLFLLNNVVRLIKNQEMPDLLERTAHVEDRVYDQLGAWDTLFLSWLRPATAWSGLAVLLVFLCLLWVAPFAPQSSPSSEYETLLFEANQGGGSTAANLTDAELERWLEEGGTAK